MRRKWVPMLAILCALCMVAAGCAGTDVSSNEPDKTPSSQTDTSTDEQREVGTGVVITGENTVNAAGTPMEIANQGKLRIQYSGIASSVVYVTSASELPGYDELRQYDDAYFEEHALVLVTDTSNSGSVDVGILSININDLVATVTLYHEAPEEGEYNTDDMATWLLWAEVEPGLECRWLVANPSLKPDLEAN